MRRLSQALPLVLLLSAPPSPRPAAAQAGPEANLVLTVSGGVVTGTTLWTIGRQPFCPVTAGGSCASTPDTLRLSREQTSSIIIGAAMSYFPTQVLGVQGEITYLGLPLQDACAVLNSGPTAETDQVCRNVQGQSQSTGAISFFASVVARATPRRAISPFARAGLGLVAFDHSTIELAGAASNNNTYQVLRDDKPRRLAPSAVLAGGATFPFGSGYQFRLEVRDVISGFERPTGAADALLQPPTDTRFYHHLALTMGLDVVLERKRGRRY